jgi:SET domain-containing protein
MAIRQSDALEVKRVKGKGRGVFARRTIAKGEVFETCPVLILPASSIPDYSVGIGPYVFEWGKGKVALTLGFGSLYNHSYKPNARYDDVGPQSKAFTALREIAPGEEITINYNGDPAIKKKVWFDVIESNGKPAKPGASRVRK